MRLQINQISSKYAVKELTETDIDEIYELELLYLLQFSKLFLT